MLLPIDQFEEFLAPSAGSRASKFLNFLQHLCQARDDRLLVIGTLRSDYLDVYERHPHALKTPIFHPWRLGPLPAEQLENVIEKPACRAHVTVAPELVERLKQDTPTTDALPLLAFTLEKLYRKHGGDKLLELHEYLDMRGMEGAIKETAEKVMPSVETSSSVESAVRLCFVKHLVEINDKGDFVRLTARWQDLDPVAKPILEEFVSQRLFAHQVRARWRRDSRSCSRSTLPFVGETQLLATWIRRHLALAPRRPPLSKNCRRQRQEMDRPHQSPTHRRA